MEKTENKANAKMLFEIDFGGHILAQLAIVEGKIQVINCINGYGNAVSKEHITIKEVE